MKNIIELLHVSKDYPQAHGVQTVLHNIDLVVSEGEFVAIVGPSGNGKSTLLNLLSGIDYATRGEVWVTNVLLNRLSSNQLSKWRCQNLGIVFQFFQLLPALNVLQNIMLPMDFADKLSRIKKTERAEQLLDMVGLSDMAYRLPSELSGGQQQRVAIARSLANDPPLIVADEPTGNLDADTAESVFQLFSKLACQGKTLIMVTHNEQLAIRASRKIEILSGRIHTDNSFAP